MEFICRYPSCKHFGRKFVNKGSLHKHLLTHKKKSDSKQDDEYGASSHDYEDSKGLAINNTDSRTLPDVMSESPPLLPPPPNNEEDDSYYDHSSSVWSSRHANILASLIQQHSRILASNDIVSKEAALLDVNDSKEFNMDALEEQILDVQSQIDSLLKFGSFKSFFEIDLLLTVLKSKSSLSYGQEVLNLIRRHTTPEFQHDIRARELFNSIWRSVRKKALDVMVYSKNKQNVKKIMWEAKYEKRKFCFSHELLNENIEFEYTHVSPLALIRHFVREAKDCYIIPPERFMGADSSYVYGDIHTGKKIHQIRAEYRRAFQNNRLQLLPVNMFVDLSAINTFGRSMVPIYVSNGLVPFEKRNQDIVMLGFYPEKVLNETGLLKVLDKRKRAQIQREYRQAFFNFLLEDFNIPEEAATTSVGFTKTSSSSRGFDFYNQNLFSMKELDFPLILYWNVFISDYPEGCQCLAFFGKKQLLMVYISDIFGRIRGGYTILPVQTINIFILFIAS